MQVVEDTDFTSYFVWEYQFVLAWKLKLYCLFLWCGIDCKGYYLWLISRMTPIINFIIPSRIRINLICADNFISPRKITGNDTKDISTPGSSNISILIKILYENAASLCDGQIETFITRSASYFCALFSGSIRGRQASRPLCASLFCAGEKAK